MRIMNEVSFLDAHNDDINVLTLDDPELFKYPIAYIIEVGWWTLTDAERPALRAYIAERRLRHRRRLQDRGLARHRPAAGGSRSRRNMKRVLPGAQFFEMDADASDLPLLLRDRTRSTISRRPTTAAGRSSTASTRTTIRPSGC